MHKKIGVGHAYIGRAEREYVNQALDAGRLSAGEFVFRFERQFAELHGCRYGMACNSGTSALHVALECLKEQYNWKPKAEIIVPAITFIATSNACLHAGLRPVFVDVDPLTYNIDPRKIEEKITSNTVAIMPVHTFGQPCEMDQIMSIATQHKLYVIEDCAEAHFASYKGKPVGSFGHLAGFSTYVAHTITTGVGGVITTNHTTSAEICRSLIAHGRACTCEICIASNPDAVCKLRTQTDMDRRFMMVRLGYSYRIGELEGALGLGQIENKDLIMQKRLENANTLTVLLEGFADRIQLPTYPEYVTHSFMMFPIVLRPNNLLTRKQLTDYLETQNIECRPMLPLLNQPVYIDLFGDLQADYPVARWINQAGFYVGCHHGLDKDDMEYVARKISYFLTKTE